MGHPFLRRSPIFRSSAGQSESIREIAPKVLTLRRDLRFRYRETGYGVTPPYRNYHETSFHEIDMVSRKTTRGAAVKSLINNIPERREVSRGVFLDEVLDVFVRAVEEAWIPERFHVILHSGGYDSRLISWVVKKLYDRNGADWLGDVLFLEVEGEHKHSWQSLEAEGWERSRFVRYGEGPHTAKKHHIRSCEFANAWRRHNGEMWSRGFNLWYEPIEWLQETGCIPSDDSRLQGWSGVFANDVAHALINGPGLVWVFKALTYHVYTLAPTKGEWVFPFLSLDLMRVIYEYGSGQQETQEQSYRRHVLERHAPEVGAVHNPQRGEHAEWLRRLSDPLCERMLEEYHESWYGQNVAPDVKIHKGVGFSPWWGHWGLASLCEELLRGGHKIRRER